MQLFKVLLTIFSLSLSMHLASTKATIDPNAKVDATANIGNYATIFAYAEIQAGASVGSYTVIKEYVKLLRGSSVGSHAQINDRSVIAKRVDNYGIIGQDVTINGNVGSYTEVKSGVIINSGTLIGKHTNVNRNCVIGNNTKVGSYVKIGENVTIGNNIFINDYASIGTLDKINDGAIIDKYATIDANAIVSEKAYVGKYAQLRNGVNVGVNSVIHQYTIVPQNYKVLDNRAVINAPSSLILFNIVLPSCNINNDYLNATPAQFSNKMLDWMNSISSNALKQCQTSGNIGSYQLDDFRCLVKAYLMKYYGADAFNTIQANFHTDINIQQQLKAEIHFGQNPKQQILSKNAADVFVILLTANYDLSRDLRVTGDTACSMLTNLLNKQVIVDVVDVPSS